MSLSDARYIKSNHFRTAPLTEMDPSPATLDLTSQHRIENAFNSKYLGARNAGLWLSQVSETCLTVSGWLLA